MIKFHCSKCNKKIAVPDESIGKRCQCPKCKTISVVPDTSSSTEMPATNNLIHFKCSQCKQELEAPEVMRGKTILCHHCQANTVVSEHELEPSENDEPMPFKLKEQTKDCPYCGEEILEKAIKCKHCGEFLESNAVNSYQPSYDSPPIQNTPSSPDDFNWKPILYLLLIVGGIISVLSLSSSTIKELFQDSKPREIQIPKENAHVNNTINDEYKPKLAGLVNALRDIESAYEIGMNYADFKQLVFNLNREWNSIGYLPEEVKKVSDYNYAERAVNDYKEALRYWIRSIEYKSERYSSEKSRDKHLKDATFASSIFISNYERDWD